MQRHACAVLALGALLLVNPPLLAQQTLTQADLLRRLIDLRRLPIAPPAGEKTGMFSSYDRASKIDAAGEYVDWDANYDRGQFLRKEGEWDVMAEMDGPGAITRIWSANPEGDLRIVLDGVKVLDLPFAELLSGTKEPFVEPLVHRGLNCFVPLGYAQRCQVLCRGSTSYYQVNYVQFPSGTQVQRFNLPLDDAAQTALEEVKTAFKKGLSNKQLHAGQRMMPVAAQEDLGPGKTMTWDLEGAGTVRGLYVGLTDRDDPRVSYALHRFILRIFVDGETEPSVEAPLVDFFGSGFDLTPFNSLVMGTDNWQIDLPLPGRRLGEDHFMYCYFPMPYRQGMKVEIQNLNEEKKPIGLLLFMRVDTTAPPEDALRFYARYRKEDPCKVLDYPLLETSGRGRVVGVTLNVDCPRKDWWGEGDEKIWIDGEKFPSYFGTGTEDFLGDAWGLHPFIHALHGATRVAPFGKNSAYRWFLPDTIEFQKSIRFTLENWQAGGAQDTYYSTVVYWYGEPQPQPFFKRLTLADVTPPGYRVPGALEVEETIVGPQDWGNTIHERFVRDVQFSKEHVANISTQKPVDFVIKSDQARVAMLYVRANPRQPFETFTVAAGSQPVGVVTYDREREGEYHVGVVRLVAGDNHFTLTAPRSVQLDCWVLADVPRNGRGPEGEELEVRDAGGVKLSEEFARLPWSGGAQRVLDFPGRDATVTFALPKQEHERDVALRIHVTQTKQDGTFEALVNDAAVGIIDVKATKEGVQRYYLGTARLQTGENTLGFKAVKGLRLGLDVVELAQALSPHAIEAEELKVAAFEGTNHERQGIGGASGDEHLWCRPTKAGAWIELEVPVKQRGKYDLALILTRSFDYGTLQAYVNGEKAGTPTDTFASKIGPGLVVPLGTHELPALPLKIKVEVTGKSDASPGYYFGVDAVVLTPAK